MRGHMSRRDVAIVGITALVLVVLAAAFGGGYLLSRSTAKASTGASPSASAAPTPSSSPAPSPAATHTASGGGGTVLTPNHAQLQAGAGSDTGPGRGNGGPSCQIWVDPGWTLGDCALTTIQPTNPPTTGTIAWVTEHKAGSTGEQWGVFLMLTNPDEAYWHTKLASIDTMGGLYGHITVKAFDVTGDGNPELIVGFRINGPGNALAYDVVQLSATHSLTLAAHNDLRNGQAKLEGGGITEYDAAASGFTQSHVTYAAGVFTSTPVGNVSSAPVGDFP